MIGLNRSASLLVYQSVFCFFWVGLKGPVEVTSFEQCVAKRMLYFHIFIQLLGADLKFLLCTRGQFKPEFKFILDLLRLLSHI